MVYCNELSGSFYDVFILRIESNEVRMMYISLPKPKTITTTRVQTNPYMYSYFHYRFRVPRGVAMFITSIQLVQMVVGCVVNYIVYVMKEDGLECHVSDRNIKVQLRYPNIVQRLNWLMEVKIH